MRLTVKIRRRNTVLNNITEQIKALEKGIEMRQREIKSHEETIKHFEKIIEELKKELSGQGDLWN